MNNRLALDHEARLQALDPSSSFIVQAPAGSGKTTLLVQRFLRLLLTVESPESIWAVTFTRKAAHEMRHRLIQALIDQKSELAQAVRARDEALGWHLIENPHRLQMMTIDAMSRYFSERLPLLLKGGVCAAVESHPRALYELATERFLNQIWEENSSIGQSVAILSRHYDNRLDALQNDLCDLLAKRDQWLAMTLCFSGREEARAYLEHHLGQCVERSMAAVRALIPADCLSEAFGLLGEESWQKLADMFLTQKGEWRLKVDKRQGFAAHQKAEKESWKAILERLKGIPGLEHALADLRRLPDKQYTEAQWLLLSQLFELLPHLVAHLRVVFMEKQRVDFVEMLLNAEQALGNVAAVSDLTLSLDYRLQHILVDEFQDTSNTQFQLFESLVSGWEPGDGRTLFLVGDPMQSIYRFRGAGVALFYQVQERGIGPVRCRSLSLKQNFRSRRDLVQGVNHIFSKRMVRFSEAAPLADAAQGRLEYKTFEDAWSEAAYLSDSIAKLKQVEPHCSIAVLGRARGHLQPALKALKQASIAFVAYDLDTLEQNACVRDLLTLLQAILDWNHRLAWVALLRSPLIGLSIADCTVLLEAFDYQQSSEPLAKGLWLGWESLDLGDYAVHRLSYIVPIFERWIEQYQAESLFLWLKTLWHALGGPAAYVSTVLSAASLFFRALEQETWKTLDYQRFEMVLLARFDNRVPDNPHAVQVMTIHKAKGLEFDYVFLLACHKQVAGDSKSLIRWMEYPSERGGVDWVLAPIPAYGSIGDPIYDYLTFLEKRKAEEEMVRLFYVGVTRAKKACFMSQYGEKSRSFQSLLEGILEPEVDSKAYYLLKEGNDSPKSWFRLSSTWKAPGALTEAICLEKPIEIDMENAQWQSAGYNYNAKKALDESTAFGTTIHFLLEMMAKQGFFDWFNRMQHRTLETWRVWLESMGVSDPSYQALFIEWLKESPSDERLQWILADHEQAHNEWVLCKSLGGHSIQRQVIDRSFVAEGKRWIIDYKTGDVARDRQEGHWEVYVSQLSTYVNIVSQLPEPYPIQAALYYPLSKTWCLITT